MFSWSARARARAVGALPVSKAGRTTVAAATNVAVRGDRAADVSLSVATVLARPTLSRGTLYLWQQQDSTLL